MTRRAGEAVIRLFPDIANIADIPVPAENELNEYPMPAVPDHVPAVTGAKKR